MEERRKFVRLDTRLDVTYTIVQSGQTKQTVTKDVGGGGICLFTEQLLPPGTQLNVAMKLPNTEQLVHFIGEIVWSEPYEVIGKAVRHRAVEVGVRFVEIAPKDQAAVMQHVILSLRGPHSTP